MSTSPQTRGSRFSVSASNGIAPMTVNTSAEPPQAGSSPSAVQIPHRTSSSILGRFQERKQPSSRASKSKVPLPLPSRRVDMKAAQEKEHFPPPPAFIDTPLTGSQPQEPTLGQYHPKAKRKTGASHPSGEASAGITSSSAHDISGAHGKGRRGRKRSDPHAVGSTLSSGSSKGKASSSPATTRSSRSQRASNGIMPAIANNSAQPPPLRGSARNVISPKPTAAVPSLENLDTSALRRSVDFVFLKIQDFGYAENDPRRQYDLTINLHDPPRPPSPAPPGFIPPMNMDETEESEASSESGSKAGQTPRAEDGPRPWLSKGSFDAEDYDHQPHSQIHLDPIDFTPGVYRALYAYEPEGLAEMALEEDQEVRCLGRDGREGWLVAAMELTDTGEFIHALVPEGHMQLIRPLEDNELEEAMGKWS
ncbi:hypothetical protein FS837_001532 [Tulasnella sp. UAMH 9824]|nr:hypothetical protein FS837_001532 [Tulasnella sp. UAMH 9824]